MTYPSDIYEQRPLENLPGLEYDPLNKKTLFAEDILRLGHEIEQIEDTLGLNLSNIEDLINYIVDGKLESKWPIGTAYINFSDSTNPAELLGFGTWVLDAEGRVLVGKATSGTFATAGTTHGEERVTLTINEMPAHKHRIRTDTSSGGYLPSGKTPGTITRTGSANGTTGTFTDRAGDGYVNSSNLVETVGGGEAHNNLQPSLVVYIWRRTA